MFEYASSSFVCTDASGVIMPTRNVNLTDTFDAFITEQIAAGRYRNASEVMRAGLRLLQQHSAEQQEKLTALRRLAAAGLDELDQGRGIEFSTVSELERHVAGLGATRGGNPSRRRA